MKTIKKYLMGLPRGTKIIVGLNILVYVLFTLLFFLTGIELHRFFAVYPTYSENFHFYQIITCMFVHSIEPTHVIMNLIFVFTLVPNIEKRIGLKNLVISFIIIGITAFISVNFSYHNNKQTIEKQINDIGIDVSDIKLNNSNSQVSQDYLITFEQKRFDTIEQYNHIISKSYGVSGFLFGIILLYVMFNIFNLRKILVVILCLYMMITTFTGVVNPPTILNGSHFAHFGGLVGGLMVYIYLKIKKGCRF